MENTAKNTMLSGSVNKPDRISNLPIPLLHHILSSLPPHNMVQTCVLSKNWRNIWCSAPDLDISYDQMDSTYFEQFVDFLLLTRDGSNIHKFSFFIEPGLQSDNSESEAEAEDDPQFVAKFDLSPTKVNAWILYALRHNVEVLEITSYVSLTPLLFSCGSLRELKLTLTSSNLGTPSSLKLPSSVNVPFLRVLHLNDFDIQAGELDDALFSAIPYLETLSLEDCRFSLKKLSIGYTCKLKTLIMTGSFLNHFELAISSPNLKFLKLDSRLHGIKTMRFTNNCIQLSNAYIGWGVSCPQSVIELFAVLRNTSSLKLSSLFLKSFTSQLQNGFGIMDCIKTPFQNLTHMELGTVFSDEEARVINSVLCHSPCICIEVLRIEVGRSYNVIVGESFEAADVWSVFKLSRLKLVEINDFQATRNEIRFVKFILENASVLEDMIISTTRFGPRSTRMKKVGKELLLYPHASSTLVMLFG